MLAQVRTKHERDVQGTLFQAAYIAPAFQTAGVKRNDANMDVDNKFAGRSSQGGKCWFLSGPIKY